jgi:hypothetical protein
MYTKPCERAGCDGVCRAGSRRAIEMRKFCSKSCSWRMRIRAGFQPSAHFTESERSKIGRLGGAAAAVQRRRKVVRATVERVSELVPESILAKLQHREQLAIKLLLARAYERGHKRGVFTERQRWHRLFAEQAQKVTEAAA